MIDDWTGTRFTTSHRCFGGPCPEALVQLDSEGPAEAKVFKVGDLQEHRYSNPKAWKQGAWPAKETEAIENVGRLVDSHYDTTQGRFKSHWEVLREQEIASNAADAA